MAGQWEDVKETVSGVWEDITAPEPYDPKKAQREMLLQNANDMSFGKAALIGAGREFDKLGSGIADLFDTGMEYLGSEDATVRRADRAADQKQKDELFDPLGEERWVATSVGSVLPYLATLPIGMTSGAARATTSLAPNLAKEAGKRFLLETGAGAATGAAHYDDTALSGAAWGAGGNVAGKWMGDLLGGAKKHLRGDEEKVIKFAKDNKLYVPPGMATGNQSLQQMDRALQTHRLTSDKVADKLDQSKRVENSIIAKEMGGPKADWLTDDYMEAQRKRITDKMDELVAGSKGDVTEDMAYTGSRIVEDYVGKSIDGKAPAILRNAESKLYQLYDEGGLDGETYQNITKNLRAQASNQYNSPSGDRILGKSLSDIANLFDEAIESGVGSAGKADWKEARKQFALLSSVDELRDVTGNVDTSALARKFKSSDKINNLAKVEELRKKQKGASLGTSGLLGKMINPTSPSESIGAAGLLSGRMSGGLLGLDDFFADIYLKGYPHSTGIIPGINKNNLLENFIGRSAHATEDGNENN